LPRALRLGRSAELKLASGSPRQLLLALPVASLALGMGFAAQGMWPRSNAIGQSALLDTLLEVPPSSAMDTAMASEQLLQLQAQRGRTVPEAAAAAPAGQATALVEPAAAAPVDLEIRVALLKAGQSPLLSATGPWQLVTQQGGVLQQGKAGEPVQLASLWAAGPEAWLQTGGSALLVNGAAYAGRLRLIQDNSGLRVINHLSLERYITSVVGAEMPSSWSMEALRAQAVAARSYALAHMARPANPHWNLGDTTRWQAYRGLASVNERTQEAVASTAGLILSYQGAIVESLYAATTQITMEAHGHLGASMSQHGAQELAQRGYTYNQILGHYYQGASLARLKAGGAG
jgi:stage II sporulation protein D